MAKVPPPIRIRDTYANIVANYNPTLYEGVTAFAVDKNAEMYAVDKKWILNTDPTSLNTSGIYRSDSLPPYPALDLNYADKMALFGPETYARAGTDTYTDIVGASQTAAIDTPAFDRLSKSAVNNALVPGGLKTGSSGQCQIAAVANILPASGFTVVLDVDAPSAFSGNGPIMSLSSGSVTNRVHIERSSTFNALFVVQSAGSVVVNNQNGTQTWYGGPRRLVLSCAANAFHFADDARWNASVTSGALPTGLTRLDIGWSSLSSTYFTGWVRRLRILPVALSLTDTVNLAAGDTPVACWGDSLTAGTGASGPAGQYTEVLRMSRYPHSGVYNGGVGGETSTQIKTRALADTIRNGWTTVIWAGRNNYSDLTTVVADVQAIVANLTHSRFLVMSVINRADGTENSGSAAYNQIVACNAALAAAFSGNYLDIRSLIVSASGGSNDAPNSSWTSDGLHLNNTGYSYVASQVSAWLANRRWF